MNAILENIETWTKHAALWHAVQPLYSRLKNSGFNKILLNEIDKIKDEEFVRGKLNEWHKILDPEHTFKKYQEILSEIDSLNVREKLQKWIHGKKFWEQHVSRKMNSFFGQKDPDEHAIDIWRYRGIPEDWDEIWQKIEAFQPALKIKK